LHFGFGAYGVLLADHVNILGKKQFIWKEKPTFNWYKRQKMGQCKFETISQYDKAAKMARNMILEKEPIDKIVQYTVLTRGESEKIEKSLLGSVTIGGIV
jgi:hypothetical protein